MTDVSDLVPRAPTLDASDAAARAEALRAAQAKIGIATKDFRAAIPFGVAVHHSRPDWRARLHHTSLIALVEGYETGRDGSALVTGPSGIGKSTATAATCHRLLGCAFRAGDVDAPIVRGMWVSAPQLQVSRYATKRGAIDELLAHAMAARLLVLDELGGEDGDGRWLMTLADERYRAGLPTLTTSGFALPVLRERYGVGAVRKLIEPIGTHLDLFGARGG